jgi:transcriptional regulator with XRE-family HTH domain
MARQSRNGASQGRSQAQKAQPTGTALGDWIREARMAQGVSQRALADRSGLSRSYLCDIERGRGAQPSVLTLDKLAVALGASRTDLLQVAGILEAPFGKDGGEHERRLIAVVRDLSPDSRELVERFARFMHAEEHRWTQQSLIDAEAEGEDRPIPTGPGLFDQAEFSD